MDFAMIALCALVPLFVAQTIVFSIFLCSLQRQVERTRANLYCVQKTLDSVLKEREAEEPEERSRKDLVDEGFENIMRFSVNGRTGFEFSGKE